MLDLIVPSEYQEVLTSLLGKTPQSSYESVCRVVKLDLGASPLELYDSFSVLPIASASLAQVHIARKGGETFAVKVQHEGLAESAPVDMYVITTVVGVISSLFRDFDYNWLSKEMNRNVPQELDFNQERANIAKAADNLAAFVASGDVALPSVQEKLSGRRVLTMSYETGCYVSDVDKIDTMGLSKTQIASLLSKVFWEQIFRHGFVHCDPHPQNLLVRPHPTAAGRAQIVLLDHGLYRQLDKDFRKDYCRLWQGLALSSEQRIETYCRRIGAGGAFSLLAAMITQRPWDDIVSKDMSGMSRLHGKGLPAESVMLRSYAQKYFKEIVLLLGRVPSDLLLLFKTTDCLRHLDKLLGAPVNTAAVAASTVADVILSEELAAFWGSSAEQAHIQHTQHMACSGGTKDHTDHTGHTGHGADSADRQSSDMGMHSTRTGAGGSEQEQTPMGRPPEPESGGRSADALEAWPLSLLSLPLLPLPVGLLPRLGRLLSALGDWYHVQLRVLALQTANFIAQWGQWGQWGQLRQPPVTLVTLMPQ
jgi:aarF domain-containing kinase